MVLSYNVDYTSTSIPEYQHQPQPKRIEQFTRLRSSTLVLDGILHIVGGLHHREPDPWRSPREKHGQAVAWCQGASTSLVTGLRSALREKLREKPRVKV